MSYLFTTKKNEHFTDNPFYLQKFYFCRKKNVFFVPINPLSQKKKTFFLPQKSFSKKKTYIDWIIILKEIWSLENRFQVKKIFPDNGWNIFEIKNLHNYSFLYEKTPTRKIQQCQPSHKIFFQPDIHFLNFKRRMYYG